MASLKYSTYIDFIKLTLKHSLGFLEGLIQKFLLARVGAFRLGVGSERVGVGKCLRWCIRVRPFTALYSSAQTNKHAGSVFAFLVTSCLLNTVRVLFSNLAVF